MEVFFFSFLIFNGEQTEQVKAFYTLDMKLSLLLSLGAWESAGRLMTSSQLLRSLSTFRIGKQAALEL